MHSLLLDCYLKLSDKLMLYKFAIECLLFGNRAQNDVPGIKHL